MKKYGLKKSQISLFVLLASIFASCRTTEPLTLNEVLDEKLIEEKPKQVVILEEPETIYQEEVKNKDKIVSDAEALTLHLKDITEKPEYNQNQKRLKAWKFTEGHLYQVHCQTYHSTMILLEPGEELTENPYLSEIDVWKWSRGTAYENGNLVQVIFVKPDFRNLISTMTLITNRRIYLLELRSYTDHYMPYVRWVYDDRQETLSSYASYGKNQINGNEGFNLTEYLGQNAEFVSFDYKIRPSRKNIDWKPIFVCDDGRKTYIVLDKRALNTSVPAVFKSSYEIVNSEYKRNVIIVNELIKKVTLRKGKEKCTIKKLKSKK